MTNECIEHEAINSHTCEADQAQGKDSVKSIILKKIALLVQHSTVKIFHYSCNFK